VNSQPQLEAIVVRKAAWRVLPIIFLSYIVCYLDRSNIGIAALGMMPALKLNVAQFGLAAGVFFIGYCLGELPSNLLQVRFGARRWLARIMISWGLLAVAMAFVVGPASLYVLRILLGFAEAGFAPGAIFFLAYWFPAAYRGRVLGAFILAIPVSMIIGAPVSGALLDLRGLGGLDGWQWLFIVEGSPAVLLGVVCLLYLPSTPEEAKWLTKDEARLLTTLFDSEKRPAANSDRGSVGSALSNPQMWSMTAVSVGLSAGSYSLVFFLPQIITAFGVSHVQTGLLTALPFFVAILGILFWSHHSDRTGERRWHMVLPMAAAAAGLLAASLVGAPTAKMAALTAAAAGIYMSAALFWNFVPMFFPPGRTAAAAIAIINMVGGLTGFFCPYMIGMLKQATGSFSGGLICSTVLVAGGALMAWRMTAEKVRHAHLT
jgi:MFS transporter, ACS family, tartrate transporter